MSGKERQRLAIEPRHRHAMQYSEAREGEGGVVHFGVVALLSLSLLAVGLFYISRTILHCTQFAV